MIVPSHAGPGSTADSTIRTRIRPGTSIVRPARTPSPRDPARHPVELGVTSRLQRSVGGESADSIVASVRELLPDVPDLLDDPRYDRTFRLLAWEFQRGPDEDGKYTMHRQSVKELAQMHSRHGELSIADRLGEVLSPESAALFSAISIGSSSRDL